MENLRLKNGEVVYEFGWIVLRNEDERRGKLLVQGGSMKGMLGKLDMCNEECEKVEEEFELNDICDDIDGV